jgi:hypothetical protein
VQSSYKYFILFHSPISSSSPSSSLLPISSHKLSLSLSTVGTSFHTLSCLICSWVTPTSFLFLHTCGRTELSSTLSPPIPPKSSKSPNTSNTLFSILCNAAQKSPKFYTQNHPLLLSAFLLLWNWSPAIGDKEAPSPCQGSCNCIRGSTLLPSPFFPFYQPSLLICTLSSHA